MLRAFQKQLERLAVEDAENFSMHLKRRYGSQPPQSLVDELREFILMLPQVQKKIVALWMWLPTASKLKNIGSHFMVYMYQPNDFLPESDKNGLLSYLDDAYIAAEFYELMLGEIESTKTAHVKKEDHALLKKMIGLKRKARSIIPDEAIAIKQMLGELLEGDETTYRNLFPENMFVESVN